MNNLQSTTTTKYSFYGILLMSMMMASACSNNKDVLIFNRDIEAKTITIDDQVITLDSNATFTVVPLAPGTHTIESGGILPETVDVTGDCLVASGDTKFVIFPVTYQSEESINRGSALDNSYMKQAGSAIIVGDTTIIYYGAKDQTQLVESMTWFGKGHENCVGCKPYKAPLRILEPVGNVYPKSWAYTIDNLPEEIYLRDRKEKEEITMMDFDLFEIYTMMEDEFKREDVRGPGTLEKVKWYNKVVYGIE